MDWRGAEPVITWRPRGRTRFTEPFFEDALRKSTSDPEVGVRRCHTGLDALLEIAGESTGTPRPALAGFIYHASRCGSTLAAQMLATIPGVVVFSEPPPLEAVLRREERSESSIRILRALVSAWTRALPESLHFIVKLDSWHILHWRLLHAAFPATPSVFVSRDPLEILASHARRRGTQMVPGLIAPERFGWDLAMIRAWTFEEYAARVLATLGGAALEAARSTGLRLLDYSEFPDVALGPLPAHFGLSVTPSDRDAMEIRARSHAKSPDEPFRPDAAAKRASAAPELIQATEAHARAVYRQLESARTSGLGLAPFAVNP